MVLEWHCRCPEEIAALTVDWEAVMVIAGFHVFAYRSTDRERGLNHVKDHRH
jgi:hypothetical protein